MVNDMTDHHHTYITPTSISQIQQLILTGPAQGKGGVYIKSRFSCNGSQEYFVFLFCMSSIYIKVSDKMQKKNCSLESWFCGFIGDDIFWNFENWSTEPTFE